MLTADALEALHAFGTPGNERELKNVIRDLKRVILGAVEKAPRARSPSPVAPPPAAAPAPAAESAPEEPLKETLSEARHRAERSKLLEALDAHGGNRVRAAQHLGISRAGLYRLLDKYGVG